jgi:ferrous iron transport protein A
MGKAQKSLADLKLGEKGTICCFKDEEMSLKLMEMGCLPGVEVEVSCMAPFGGPICITVSGYNLSLRTNEAATIMLLDK